MSFPKEPKEIDCLRELRGLIKESGDDLLLSVLNDEKFLRTFVIGRKYNVKHAFETVKAYLKSKTVKHKDLYEMPPESVRHVLESGFIGMLRHPDHLGRPIGFMRFAKINLDTMEHSHIIRAIILMSEACWQNYAHVKNGQVFVADFTGYNLSIMTRYSISQKLTLVNIFWNNYPSKVKGVHVYNNPKIFSYAYSLIRPFLPDKFKRRVRLHGKDVEDLHDFLSPDILPVWLGGNLSDEEAINHDVVRRALS